MAATPDQRPTTTNRPSHDHDASPPEKRRATRIERSEPSSDPKRKQACDDLDERFPEQCDAPLAENEPARVMPDEKEADSRPSGGDGR